MSRFARVSSASRGRTRVHRDAGQAGRGGGAIRPGRGAGRAAGTAGPRRGLSVRYDQENTARTSVAGRRRRSVEGARSPQLGGDGGQRKSGGGGSGGDDGQGEGQPRAPVDDVVDRGRLGRHPVARRAGGPAGRGLRARLSRSRVTGWAPSAATRPVSRSRLVTIARQPVRRAAAAGPARRRGRCPAPPAPACPPAGCGTARPARPGRPGIRAAGTPSASRKPRSASAGGQRGPAGSKPRRLT